MIVWENCVLWLGYPLQDGVWPDISKYDNDGIIIGAFWEGDSIEFDGIDDYVNCGGMGNLGSEMNVNKPTFQAWMKSEVTNRRMGPMGTLNDGGATAVMITINVDVGGSVIYPGHIRFYLRDEDGQSLLVGVHTNTGITDGGWHHLSVSWDGPNNTVYIYVDGVSQTIVYDRQNTPDNFANFQYPFWLGNVNLRGSIYSPFEGQIKQCRIYNKILTQEQIREGYEQTYKLI